MEGIMDYLALYRKYRPRDLNEVVGQDEIKKINSRDKEDKYMSLLQLFFENKRNNK